MLRLLKGEPIELASREANVTAAELSTWRETFLAAGEASLKIRLADDHDGEIPRLEAKIGNLTMATELPDAMIDRLEGGRSLARRRSKRRAAPSRPPPVGSSGSPGSAASGVSPARESTTGVSRSWRGPSSGQGRVGRWPTPGWPWPLRANRLRHPAAKRHRSEDLRGAADLVLVDTAPASASASMRPAAPPTSRPRSRSARRSFARRRIIRLCRRRGQQDRAGHHGFGTVTEGAATGTKLRQYRGRQFVSDDFEADAAVFGLERSPAFVREPEGNGCAERFSTASNYAANATRRS